MTQKDEIADLKREISDLKAKVAGPPPLPSEQSTREWQDQMHQMRERHMAKASHFTREDLRAMEAACPTSSVRDIVAKGGVPSPSGMLPTTSQIGEVHTAPGIVGSGRGWVMPAPLGPQPGQQHMDRIVDEFDRRDKAELAERLRGKR